MNSTAFLTTVYPGSDCFIKEMLVSLAAQTCTAFDLVILNDGVENLIEFVDAYAPLMKVIEVHVDKSPVKNREYGINYCIKSGYQKLIFGDSDDWFCDKLYMSWILDSSGLGPDSCFWFRVGSNSGFWFWDGSGSFWVGFGSASRFGHSGSSSSSAWFGSGSGSASGQAFVIEYG